MREENILIEEKPKSLPRRVAEQVNDPLIYVLLFAGAVSAILSEWEDTLVILLVVALNTTVGVIQEGKAEEALSALKKLSAPKALVRVGGEVREVPASTLRPGDTVLLEAGRQVPADLRLTRTVHLFVEESALTGESLPVEKDASQVSSPDQPLGDRKDMTYMSTMVTGGAGEGVVTHIGMETEIGKIAAAIRNTPAEATPLQRKLGDLGEILSILAVLLCALLYVLALLQHRPVLTMLITAISLAVAAVPEGLPAIVTIVLAMSVSRLVKVHTIVRRLPAVETLGAVSVICTDKTGTLTRNRMEMTECYWNRRLRPVRLLPTSCGSFLAGFVLCNDSILEGRNRVGDSTELALLDLAAGRGVTREGLEKAYPRTDETAFDSVSKRMTTVHRGPGGAVTFIKGAPDRLLPLCGWEEGPGGSALPLDDRGRMRITAALKDLSARGLRVLALIRSLPPGTSGEGYLFVGLAAMKDPLRPEVPGAVRRLAQAGIRTVMITGDYPDTAAAIATELPLGGVKVVSGGELDAMSEEECRRAAADCQVFARVSPHHKVRIVNALKSQGLITAMTGDGVNDAPSLKAADIGIAMGRTGTDVARNAADMVLTDDNFASIEKAVAEGRCIYENIRKSVLFLLSSNFGEIMTMFATVLLGLPVPLLAIHILWINLITDSLPALSLGIDRNSPDRYMRRPPRSPGEKLLDGGGWFCILFYGFLIGAASLTGFLTHPFLTISRSHGAFTPAAFAALLSDPELLSRSQTYTFAVLGLSQLFHTLGMKDVSRSVFRMNHRKNPLMLLSFAVCLGLQVAVTEIPLLQDVFGTCSLSPSEWGYLLCLSALPLLLHEVLVPFWRRLEERP